MSGAPAEVGSTANSYQILARLATGGMAEIFLARGASTAGVERYCVLKRIIRDRASDVHFVRMFLDEARLAAQLNHANVAQVYDIGKLGDSYFFTMEYVHGETVRAVMQRARSLRRELPLASVLTVIAGTAAGLHHAHERIGIDGKPLGIVHRDVSPSNLMVSFEGGVKVVDFGVAKATDRMQETRSGTVKGKISYLSPEQCRGKSVDRRSDLFALGIVLWEMLTTDRLYRRASDFENMNAIVNEPVPPPSTKRACPPEIDAITLRLLEKDPEARFQTADEVVDALEAAAVRCGSVISTAGLGRLLREMFGQRPEPWLDLDAHETVPVEGVTVTSEPIPAELVAAPADSLDAQLSGIPDLGGRSGISDAVPQPAGAPVTVPLRISQPPTRTATLTPPNDPVDHSIGAPPNDPTGDSTGDAASDPTDVPTDLSTDIPDAPRPPAVRGPAKSSGAPARAAMSAGAAKSPAVAGSAGAAKSPAAPGAAGGPTSSLPLPPPPPSGVHVVAPISAQRSAVSASMIAPTPVPASRSGARPAVSGSMAAVPASSGPLPAAASGPLPTMSSGPLPTMSAAHALPRRNWTMIAVIATAIVVGSLSVWFAMQRGNRTDPVEKSAAAQPVGEPAPALDATVVEPIAHEPIASAPADAALAAVDDRARDAAPVAVAEVARDAAPAPTGEPSQPPAARSPLQLAMDGQRYREVVALCTKTVAADAAAACTLAACHEKLDGKARGWFAKVASGRPKLVTACRGLGVDLAPKAPKPPRPPEPDPCEVNPMSCQH